MDNLPTLSIVLFTYCPERGHPRGQYANDTLRAAFTRLGYDGPVHWHIADDGSYPGHVDTLLHTAKTYKTSTISVSDSQRRGYGASWNAMTAVIHPLFGGGDENLVLCLEDDWVLANDLDVTPLVQAIEASHGQLRCVRLNYLGWTNALRGTVERFPPCNQTFLMLSADSPELHVFSAGPRLETVGFERGQGLWPEHQIAGVTEMAVAERNASRHGVAWPLDMCLNAALDNPTKFVHVGGVSVKDDKPV